MDEYTVKVTPEVLSSTSNSVLAKISKAQNAFEQMSAVIAGTAEHWEGQGHDKAMEHYNIRKDDYERVFQALTEHVNQLQSIAGVYQSVEKQNESIAGILPSDVIF